MKRFSGSILVALIGLAACSGGGGSGAPAAAEPAQAAGGQGASEPDREHELRAAQESAFEALCERLADCAVEDARASLSPEELAKLDIEHTAPRLRDECEEDGAKRALSPRQVRVVQRCVTEQSSCESLQDCLKEAEKKPATGASPPP